MQCEIRVILNFITVVGEASVHFLKVKVSACYKKFGKVSLYGYV